MRDGAFGRSLRIAGPWAVVAGLAWVSAAVRAEGPIVLRNVDDRTAVTFRHTDGSAGKLHIVETVASGLATFDYDGDGLIDIYFLNGAPLEGTKVDVPPKNHLYRNLGDFRFAHVTDQAGMGDTGYGLGVAVGDYDADGDADLYVSNFGPNVMYRNNGDGTFTDVARQAGTACADDRKVGAGAGFLDIEGDGDLDLFVANYLGFSYDMRVMNARRGVPVYPVPSRFPPWPSNLYRNNGDGTFTDISEQSGVGLHEGRGMGVVSADYDNDGDTDIFVSNDGPPGNFLFQNDGTGKFEEVGWLSGTAFNYAGLAYGSMGVACGDYDNDGHLDFFVTSYQRQMAALFRNLGDGLFDDVTQATGAGRGSFNQVTWGCGLVDFDNDGHKDIFYVCGHVDDNIDQLDDTTSYLAPPELLNNNGDGTFANVSESIGDSARTPSVGRGAAFDDLDNDGRVDVVILNSRRPPTILRNESANANHSIQIRLRGVKTNRDGVGARVTVTAGDLVQIDEVYSGRGYQSHYGTRLHFGLGKRTRVDRVEVRWIGGGTDMVENVTVDRLLTIVEGGAPSKGGNRPAN
ncbi:MAG: CRTAC1 family protein [Planctomycetota bacterium]